jgi:hypothetical protein
MLAFSQVGWARFCAHAVLLPRGQTEVLPTLPGFRQTGAGAREWKRMNMAKCSSRGFMLGFIAFSPTYVLARLARSGSRRAP